MHLGLNFLKQYGISINTVNNTLYVNKSLQGNKALANNNTTLKSLLDDFLRDSPVLGTYKYQKHDIPLIDDRSPINSKPFPIPIRFKNELDKELNRLLADGIIVPSSSTYSSPALLIPKKDGSIRMVIDYRKLNNITKKEEDLLPRISDILNQLEGPTIFSQIDLNSGYHQIDVVEQDKHKTSFVTPLGQFEFNKMPFGATNAPRSFQRTMNSILWKYDL